MKRVASLFLPDWPIERIVQATQGERTTSPLELAPDIVGSARAALTEIAAQEQAVACSVPRGGGWRPGARWAQGETMPRNRRAGRTSEAADHPFKAMPPDEGGTLVRDGRIVPGNRLPVYPVKAGVQGSDRIARDAAPPLARGGYFGKLGKQPPAPIVTSIQQGNKLVIAAVSPAARARGIVPGMAMTHARALVPQLDIHASDLVGDRAALLRLAMLAARRWCPIVALSDEDGLFLDITGTAHLFGGEARMARQIVRLLARAGFTARVAIADTPGAAWALARYSPRICPPAQQEAALGLLPVGALRLDSQAIDLLKRLGVETISQLAALPRAPLMRRFGGALIARLDQATGRLPEPLDPVIPPDHIAIVQRFAEPVLTAEAIAHWLDRLVPELTTRLGEAGRGARMIDLVADRIDGTPQSLRIGVARASRDPVHLKRLLLRRIETIDPGFGVDALGLHVRRSEPLGPQTLIERLDEETAPDLAPLIDTLAIRIGSERLWRTRPIESDVPERSVAPAPVLDPPERAAPRLKPGDVRQLDRTADLHPWQHRWPRPVRLLRRPELLDHVVAELPDQPPRRFAWRGTMHRVVRADGPERILGEWWKRPSERHSVRDYFRVEDEAGQRFWVFRRGDGERGATGDLAWFMHGSFG